MSDLEPNNILIRLEEIQELIARKNTDNFKYLGTSLRYFVDGKPFYKVYFKSKKHGELYCKNYTYTEQEGYSFEKWEDHVYCFPITPAEFIYDVGGRDLIVEIIEEIFKLDVDYIRDIIDSLSNNEE